MRYFLLVFSFLLGASIADAQQDSTDINYDILSGHSDVHLLAGAYLAAPHLVSPLRAGHQPVPEQLYFMGGGFKAFSFFNNLDFEANVRYQRVLPHNFLETPDEKASLKGWLLATDNGRDVFPRVNWIDVVVYHDVAFGRMRVIHEKEGERFAYTNPVFSTGGSLEIRFWIKPNPDKWGLTFGARGGHQWDISRTHWRDKDGGGLYLYRYQLTGPSALFFLSLAL